MTGVRAALRAVLLPAAAACGALAVGALLLGWIAGGVEHLGELALRCLRSPLAVLDTVAHAGSVGAVAALVAAATIMAGTVARQWATGRAIGRAVARARTPVADRALTKAAATAGVAGQVDVVAARRPFAFVYGWRRPRICISTGLIERVSGRELQAVLLHERWHAVQRDPIRLTAAAAIERGLRFVPPVAASAAQFAAAVEIAADRFVVAEMGHARWLARALLRVEANSPTPAFAGRIETRVAALVGNVVDPPRRCLKAAAAIVAEAAAAGLLLFAPRVPPPVGLALLHLC